MQPYPRSPHLVWPGDLQGTGCLNARAMDTGFPTVVWRLCLGLGCAWARVLAAPRHSWLGRWGVCVLVCALRLYPATPGWGVRCGCVCLGSGFGCAAPLLGGVFGPVCACVHAPLVPRHSLVGCAAWVCVPGLWFLLHPATPGCGVGVCVCLCTRSPCTPPLLAGVCGVGVCAWARFSAAPRHFWLGCWDVCVLVCVLRLYPAWLGCAAWVCVLGLGFRLRPATPVLGVGVSVHLCARSACTPPLLGWVCGVGVCAWARASAAPRHSWMGCWGVRVRAPLVSCYSWLRRSVWVCVLGLGFRLRPATLSWGVGVCVRSCARSACTPPFLAGVCGVGGCALALDLAAPRHSWLGCRGVCVLVCMLRLYPATPGWGVRCGCVCLGSGFGCAPPLLAGVLGCVSACVPAPLAPRHSWLGCVVWVCVLRLGFRVRPATPGWDVGVCLCLCACSACTPPFLAGVCGVGVCVRARVSAAPRHSWLGCWGVCAFVCALRLYPTTPRWAVRCGCVCLSSSSGCAPPLLAGVLGCACLCARSACTPRLLAGVCGVFGLGVAWHLFLCRGSLRVVRAARVCGRRWPLLLGTCPCAVVVAGGVPLDTFPWGGLATGRCG